MTDKQKAIKKAYDEIIKEVSDIYSNGWTYEDFMKFTRAKKFDDKLEKVLSDMFKVQTELIEGGLKKTYTMATSDEIEALEKQGIAEKALIGVAIIALLKKGIDTSAINDPYGGVIWKDRIKQHNTKAFIELSNKVRSNLFNNTSYSDSIKDIKKTFKSDLITTTILEDTEKRRVKSMGQTDVLDKVPKSVGLMKKWVTMKDERVRSFAKGDSADHVKMNGVTIPYEQDFVTPSGSKGKAPHQLTGSNALADNVRCRCVMRSVIP